MQTSSTTKFVRFFRQSTQHTNASGNADAPGTSDSPAPTRSCRSLGNIEEEVIWHAHGGAGDRSSILFLSPPKSSTRIYSLVDPLGRPLAVDSFKSSQCVLRGLKPDVTSFSCFPTPPSFAITCFQISYPSLSIEQSACPSALPEHPPQVH